MPDIAVTVSKIETAMQELADAIAAAGNPTYSGLFYSVHTTLGPILADPQTHPTQSDADNLGSSLRMLEAELEANTDLAILEIAERVHTLSSKACVNFYPEIDWYQAASVPPPLDGTEMEAGVKHKPAAE